jgi:hypothetical protein
MKKILLIAIAFHCAQSQAANIDVRYNRAINVPFEAVAAVNQAGEALVVWNDVASRLMGMRLDNNGFSGTPFVIDQACAGANRPFIGVGQRDFGVSRHCSLSPTVNGTGGELRGFRLGSGNIWNAVVTPAPWILPVRGVSGSTQMSFDPQNVLWITSTAELTDTSQSRLNYRGIIAIDPAGTSNSHIEEIISPGPQIRPFSFLFDASFSVEVFANSTLFQKFDPNNFSFLATAERQTTVRQLSYDDPFKLTMALQDPTTLIRTMRRIDSQLVVQWTSGWSLPTDITAPFEVAVQTLNDGGARLLGGSTSGTTPMWVLSFDPAGAVGALQRYSNYAPLDLNDQGYVCNTPLSGNLVAARQVAAPNNAAFFRFAPGASLQGPFVFNGTAQDISLSSSDFVLFWQPTSATTRNLVLASMPLFSDGFE